MGGLGSGRWNAVNRPQCKRLVAEQCLQINITDWRRQGYCQDGVNQATDHITTQAIAWTACNYGQARPWFVCPQCDCRAGKLFKPWANSKTSNLMVRQQQWPRTTEKALFRLNGGYRCRKCLNLTYMSSNASGNLAKERRCRQSRLRRKLKLPQRAILREFPAKPKGMHWCSYDHILDDYVKAEEQYYQQAHEQLKMLSASLEQLSQRSPIMKHRLQAMAGLMIIAKLMEP